MPSSRDFSTDVRHLKSKRKDPYVTIQYILTQWGKCFATVEGKPLDHEMKKKYSYPLGNYVELLS